MSSHTVRINYVTNACMSLTSLEKKDSCSVCSGHKCSFLALTCSQIGHQEEKIDAKSVAFSECVTMKKLGKINAKLAHDK